MDIKIVIETLRGIMYKLRKMGVPIYGPSYIHGYNISVIRNNQSPESTLRKKSDSICCHAVCEYVAMDDSLTGHIGTNNNCADLDTNILYSRKRRFHVPNLLYDIYDNL